MKIIIRADGSSKIGMGHIFRSITISKELKKFLPESTIYFVTNSEFTLKKSLLKDYESLNPLEDEKNVEELIKSGNLFISDILDTSNSYISGIRRLNPEIAIICIDNNTALKRIKDADILINANVFNKVNHRDKFDTMYFLGPKYMILREEFMRNLPERTKKSFEKLSRIFISFGGADEKGYTLKAIDALKQTKDQFLIDVVIGPLFNYSKELMELVNDDKRFLIHKQPEKIFEIMSLADLAIISAGIILYELSSLGIPSIVIPQVDHQSNIAYEFAKNKACINLGYDAKSHEIYTKFNSLWNDEFERENISKNAREFVDGMGLKRFINMVMEVIA